MRSKYPLFLALLLTVGLVGGCRDKEARYMNRLEGDWTIEKSERWIIRTDGSTEQYENLENTGTMSVYEASPPSPGLMQFDFAYTNFQGQSTSFSSLLYTDDYRRRIGMTGVLCSNVFECDLMWTVDEDKGRKQVWSAYGNQEQFFYPPDRYNPNNDSLHLKWTITLRKD